ncbi:MAG: hypothetical protein QW838_04450 [Candidatus Nitrosotenuis sp.]
MSLTNPDNQVPPNSPNETGDLPAESEKVVDILQELATSVADMKNQIQDIQSAVESSASSDLEEPEESKEPEADAEPAEGSYKWTPQSWDDFPKLVDDKAKKIAAEVVREEINKIQEEAQRAEQETIEASQKVDQEIDAIANKLEKEGKLPPITDPDDKNDPGRLFRKEFYGLAARMGIANLPLEEAMRQAAETVALLNQQGIHYDPDANKWLRSETKPTASQTAPVGSSSATTGASSGGPDYEVIKRARSLSELARRAGM